ncbi:hypothetical protein Pcinc_040298 [Petrolisthes cinctipes]|uniref:Uncharacterized protein n=1 Tax=Petrolisthes cinctipes TaxID=88211 RepID=A0AAE1BQK3_PETCI|nr:hypothetical protein Pcinc_040298 [Petrolisthes cinctipes]
MFTSLLFSCLLLGLSSAWDKYTPQSTCQPKTSTYTITRTSLIPQSQQVTEYDYHYSHTTIDITSIIFLPSTVQLTETCTDIGEPRVVTTTSFVTRQVYQTQVVPTQATFVVTQSSEITATNVEVVDETITQTAVEDNFVTNTLTVTNHETAFRTLTLTDTIKQFRTRTETNPFVLTETSYQSYTEVETQTVTSTTQQQVEATITVTEHEFVTKCHQPKITFDH